MTTAKDVELMHQQLGALIGLYQHHLDLFWKWITLYATSMDAPKRHVPDRESARLLSRTWRASEVRNADFGFEFAPPRQLRRYALDDGGFIL